MKKLISAVLVCLLLVLQACPVYAQTAISNMKAYSNMFRKNGDHHETTATIQSYPSGH